jgi:hypothetical protein
MRVATFVGVIGGLAPVLLISGVSGRTPVALAEAAETRPQRSALRLGEADVLARFTPEVRGSRPLRDRALALWRTHFAAQAAELERRFEAEEDWRPALADAAALVDDFLEASLLPRQGEFRADGPQGQAGKVWVEGLDPRTGQRVRTLRDAARRPPILAPAADKDALDGPKAEPEPAAPVPAPVRAPVRAR